MNIRNKIIAEAEKLIGTPFIHQGRNSAVGVDCIGFVLAVLKNCGVDLYENDEFGYSRIPSTFLLQEKLETSFLPIEKNEMQKGDVFLMKFGKFPQHTGFITKYDGGNLGIIHCYSQIGKVVRHRLNDVWRAKITGVYRI